MEEELVLDALIEIGREAPPPKVQVPDDEDSRFQEFLSNLRKIKDKETHFSLYNALIHHLWENTVILIVR